MFAPGGGAACQHCNDQIVYSPLPARCVQPGSGQVYGTNRSSSFVRCIPGQAPNTNQTKCEACPYQVLSRTGSSCDTADICEWDKPGLENLVITTLKSGNPELTCKPCEEGQQVSKNDEFALKRRIVYQKREFVS